MDFNQAIASPWDVIEKAQDALTAAILDRKEQVLTELAQAGIDPRMVKFDVEIRTEYRNESTFLVAEVTPRLLREAIDGEVH